MSKPSKRKQWDKAIRQFERTRALATKFDGEVKLIELSLAMRNQSPLPNDVIVKILQRQTNNSLHRIRDQINKNGGAIMEEWVAQVTWVRNMTSHSVIWNDVVMYAPTDIEETRRVLTISGFKAVDSFNPPIFFRPENADAFLELMRFCADALTRAYDDLKTQVVSQVYLEDTRNIPFIGTTISMVPMTWLDFLRTSRPT